ncbi:sigma-70 family RNA polymerase sigma factor [Lacticaseibacillus jixianensis]|uniref:Sigma-70 family RNA polymerase sigma factor n=1 Tax=Lacticaseibacillus jixianensis TaxID=2486012 RepID=A0ABW4BA22_9LACO|nr:sigma-70 family RNA polymerase sigma factor [Lacticaseibacillus jixianensis]
MKTSHAGFKLYLANQGVVHAAVRRLSVRPFDPDYDDLVEEGMLIYVHYYQHYRDPVKPAAAAAKFNKLAGLFVYYGLLKIKQREAKRPMLHERSVLAEPPGELDPAAQIAMRLDDALWAARLPRLRAQLSPREAAVFTLMVDEAWPRAAARAVLGLSQANMTNVLRRIYAKYQALETAPNAAG